MRNSIRRIQKGTVAEFFTVWKRMPVFGKCKDQEDCPWISHFKIYVWIKLSHCDCVSMSIHYKIALWTQAITIIDFRKLNWISLCNQSLVIHFGIFFLHRILNNSYWLYTSHEKFYSIKCLLWEKSIFIKEDNWSELTSVQKSPMWPEDLGLPPL